jgi:hypothetical protein
MRTLLLAIALSAPAAAQVSWLGDPLAEIRVIIREPIPGMRIPRARALDVPRPPAAPLHCRPEVIAGFSEIWKRAGYGRQDYEAAFRMDPAPGGAVALTYAPMTREPLRQTVTVIRGVTLAIANTHPDTAYPTPGPKDNDSPVPNYIVSRDALYVTVPGTRRYELVRRDWGRPCR